MEHGSKKTNGFAIVTSKIRLYWRQALLLILHAGFEGTYIFTIYYALARLNLPVQEPAPDFQPGQWQYLTFWNVAKFKAFSMTLVFFEHSPDECSLNNQHPAAL